MSICVWGAYVFGARAHSEEPVENRREDWVP